MHFKLIEQGVSFVELKVKKDQMFCYFDHANYVLCKYFKIYNRNMLTRSSQRIFNPMRHTGIIVLIDTSILKQLYRVLFSTGTQTWEQQCHLKHNFSLPILFKMLIYFLIFVCRNTTATAVEHNSLVVSMRLIMNFSKIDLLFKLLANIYKNC